MLGQSHSCKCGGPGFIDGATAQLIKRTKKNGRRGLHCGKREHFPCTYQPSNKDGRGQRVQFAAPQWRHSIVGSSGLMTSRPRGMARRPGPVLRGSSSSAPLGSLIGTHPWPQRGLWAQVGARFESVASGRPSWTSVSELHPSPHYCR